MVVLMMKDIPMTICQFKEFIKGEIMKDYAHKLHKPRKPQHWTDQARTITENIIIIFFFASLLTLISWVI